MGEADYYNKKGGKMPPFLIIVVQLENCHECFLRHFNRAEVTHSLFALFLLFQQFLLTGNIAAVALGKHVLTQSLDGFTGDDLAADCRLNGDLKLGTGDIVLQLFADLTGTRVGIFRKEDETQSVHNVTVEQNIQLDQNIVHGVEIEMRGDGFRFHIICRMLNGGELEDLFRKLADLRLIAMPADISVIWDDLNAMTKAELLEAAHKMAQINQACLATGEEIFSGDEIREAAGYDGPASEVELDDEGNDDEGEEDNQANTSRRDNAV